MSLSSDRRKSPSTAVGTVQRSTTSDEINVAGLHSQDLEVEIDLRSADDERRDGGAQLASSTPYSRWGKRTLDIFLSCFLLVCLAPLLVIVAVAVRAFLGSGPVVFCQVRIGQHGQEFTMYKFRSMLADRRVEDREFDGVDRRRTHKSDDDPRHRPLGRFLRATSLDELPQLVNVVAGHMSLVGPRPEIKEIAVRHNIIDHSRHLVRPGITGPFQLSDLRFEGRLELGFDMDTSYAGNVKLSSDCRYLLRTLAAPFRRRGR